MLWAALALLAFGALVFAFGPREPVRVDFTAPALPADLDADLEARAADVPALRPLARERIVWHGAPGAQTPLAVVYLHGFSATAEEIRPLPDDLAKALGANLFFARLTGHGQDGPALAAATVQDWTQDTARALAIGRRLGKRVLVVATSTGGTLGALAALGPTPPDGLVLISPNFRLANPASPLLTWPGVRTWGPWIMGKVRRLDVRDPAYLAAWTTEYPITALLPMAALVKHTRAQDFSAAQTPALFVFAEADRVVRASETRTIAAAWGGPSQTAPQVLGPEDDPWSHLLAGDIVSPSRTQPLTAEILRWIKGQPLLH